jgi:ribosomal protein S1
LNITEKIYGVVDFFNLSDTPSQYHLPKKLKIGGKLPVRILHFDESRKKLNFTIKPTFLSPDTPIICDFDSIEIGSYYYGYITGSNEYGFFVSFFNNIHGFLPFKDLESNNIPKNSLSLGKTLKVFVIGVNKTERKLKLSYSIKGVENFKRLDETKKQFELDSAIDLKNSEIENLEIGEVFEYKVDRKMSVNLDFLVLKTAKLHVDKKHRAVLLKEHLSDFEFNKDKLFDIYKKSKNLSLK